MPRKYFEQRTSKDANKACGHIKIKKGNSRNYRRLETNSRKKYTTRKE